MRYLTGAASLPALSVIVLALLLVCAAHADESAPREAEEAAASVVAGEVEEPAMPELVHVDSPLLEALTPPAEVLGGKCTFRSLENVTGAAPFPVDANPMITSDYRVIGFVSMFVMPPTPEEEAEWEAEALNDAEGGFMKRVEELMAARTANVRAAYVAIYEPATGGAETGVFALEFTEPLTGERQAALSVDGPGGSVLTNAHVAAAVWTDDSDRTCLGTVLEHVRSALEE